MDKIEKDPDPSPTDSMIISCMSLAMNLVYQVGDFYPLLYYFDKDDQVVSSTLDVKLQFDELDALVKTISKKEGFEDYAYAFNDKDTGKIYLSIHMGGIRYPYQMIDYKFNENGIKFSELYS